MALVACAQVQAILYFPTAFDRPLPKLSPLLQITLRPSIPTSKRAATALWREETIFIDPQKVEERMDGFLQA